MDCLRYGHSFSTGAFGKERLGLEGEFELYKQAAIRGVNSPHATAMHANNAISDGETQAAAIRIRPIARNNSIKRQKNFLELGIRYAWTIITHLD